MAVGTEATISTNVQTAVQDAFAAMQNQATINGQNDVSCFIPWAYLNNNPNVPAGFNPLCPGGAEDQNKPASNPDLEPMVSAYEAALQGTLLDTTAGLLPTMASVVT